MSRIKAWWQARKAACKFPFGHDFRCKEQTTMRGTGKYVGEIEIKERCTWYYRECKRCGLTNT